MADRERIIPAAGALGTGGCGHLDSKPGETFGRLKRVVAHGDKMRLGNNEEGGQLGPMSFEQGFQSRVGRMEPYRRFLA